MQLTLFKIGFLPVTVMDILDIIVMAFIIYRAHHFLRGSRGAQMLVGLVIIMVLSIITPLFQMRGISWIFENLRTVWLVAFVIIFQPELRRLLIYIGQSPVVRFFFKVSGSKVIDVVVEATNGALIVMVRETGLKLTVETGVRLQAEVSTPLLLSIFNPRAPLHDGAVVIQNDIIEAARCILPLAEIERAHAELGTRHRAALGVSEESDAMAIVVSEETGKISIAIDGKLRTDLSEEELKKILIEGYRYENTAI